MKVYLVHEEDGEYSDWRFNVAGVFSTHEKAVEYVLSQRVHGYDEVYELEPVPDYNKNMYGDLLFGDEKFAAKEHRDLESWYITELEIDVGAVVTHDEWERYPQFGFPKVSD